MSTLAQITAAIDDDIRNKTPLVVKTEHADVEQLITDEMFPDSVELYWDGDSQESGLPNIQVAPSLTTVAKITFRIFFEKIGNRVFYSGFLTSNETSQALGNAFGIGLATFPTGTYSPLAGRYSSSLMHKAIGTPSIQPNACITISQNAINFYGSLPIGTTDMYFEGSYKVAN